MKVIINESQFRRLLKEQRHSDFDMFGDDDGYNEDNFGKFDSDYFDEDEYNDGGFSPKMHQKSLDKKIKRSPDQIGVGGGIKIPRDEMGKEIKYSPVRKNDMSLGDYIKSPEFEKRNKK